MTEPQELAFEMARRIAQPVLRNLPDGDVTYEVEIIARALALIEEETILRMYEYLRTRKSFGDGDWAANHALRIPLRYSKGKLLS